MNIIYARMSGYDWVSVPSDAVARELQKLGHKVTIVERPEHIPVGNYDFVWSPYESVTLLGDRIKQKLGIPHVAHIEWLPPWRIQKVNPEQYGMSPDDPDLKNLEEKQSHYRLVGEAWKKADIKTLGSKVFTKYHENFLGPIEGLQYRYPSVDYSRLVNSRNTYTPERLNRIISIARGVPNKRYDLLAKVLHKTKEPVEWAVVGKGPVIDNLEKLVDNPNVTINKLGELWGWEIHYQLLKSKVYLGAFSGMPPIEAACLGCFPLIYYPITPDELTGNPLKDVFKTTIEADDSDPNGDLVVIRTVLGVALNRDMSKECKKIEEAVVTADNSDEVGISENNAKNIIKTFTVWKLGHV